MNLLLLAALSLLQSPAPERIVYEGVINDHGKTIGTTILLELSGQTVSGWIQKHGYVQIDKGVKTDTGYTFDAAANHYQIVTRTLRITYNGPDGAGDQHLNRMESLVGRVYKIREETEEGRELTLQTDHGEQTMLIEQPPCVWKRSGPPIAKFDLERFEEVLGKTVTIWQIRTGGSWSLEVLEEPAGMEILNKQQLKEKKKKKN